MNTFSFSSRLIGIGLLTLTLAVTGCKKGNDVVSPIDSDNTPAFVDKNLRISAVTSDPLIDIDGDGKPDKDLMSFLRPCDLDNTIRFEKGGRLSGDEGTVRCDGDDAADASDAKPGSWTYDAKTHVLRLVTNTSAGSKTSEWEILDSSATGLRAKVAADGNDSFRLIMTWKAQ